MNVSFSLQSPESLSQVTPGEFSSLLARIEEDLNKTSLMAPGSPLKANLNNSSIISNSSRYEYFTF